jgi:hypothetical protein
LSAEIHVGDQGTQIVVAITEGGAALDLSSASSRQIVFRKPGGDTLTLAAAVDGDPEDGRIIVLTGTESGEVEIDEPGLWLLQGRVQFPSGRWHTARDSFHVLRVLEEWP